MKGTVVRTTGKWCNVELENGEVLECSIKGKFRLSELNVTNPVAVGDNVICEKSEGEDRGVVTEILPRKNYLIRKSPHAGKSSVIGANLDQLFLIATPSNPRTSTGFIDRFLVTAEAYQIPAILIFNKADSYSEEDKQRHQLLTKEYEKIGYQHYLISAFTGQGIDQLKKLMKNKLTLLSGHSGVGKSTLINTLIPELNLKTQEISDKYKKGLHTTTYSEMYILPFGGQLIDTPGIKEFGLEGIEPEELPYYFREIEKTGQHCKFNNCLHVNEPGCAVKSAVEEGQIYYERYHNYINILEDLKAQKPY